MKELRLDKILSHMGWGTRKEIKKMMKKGLVTVEGKVITDPALKVRPQDMKIIVAGEPVIYREFIYLMMNKPSGYISATEDEREDTVLDLLSQEHQKFSPFPAGRLDKDTEGLLLLTNDGKLAHHLTSPRRKVPKTYYALVRGEVTDHDKEAFQKGIILDDGDGYRCLPAELEIVRTGPDSEIKLVIYEGKFHQVKRMFQALHKEVTYLKRLKMGNLSLDESLRPGEYRELTEEEIDLLQG